MGETRTRKLMAEMFALARRYQEGGHSVFRPSSASRWMVCAGSVWAEMKAYGDYAGEEAARGTVAHALAEFVLKHGRPPSWAKPGAVRRVRDYDIVVDDEMISYVDQYIEWIEELGLGYVDRAETRVDFSDLTPIPDQGGTADHIHISLDGVLTITDLKYGTGVRVYARENQQTLLYAYGAYRMFRDVVDIKRVVMRICQPRLDVFETWEVSVEELLDFSMRAKRAAHKAWRPDAPRTPEPKACQWCSVKATCPAFVELAERIADGAFEDLDGREIDPETISVPAEIVAPDYEVVGLTTEGLARVLRWRYPFEAFFRAAHDELLSRVTNGEHADGWKVVEGTTKRAWIDTEAVVAELVASGLDETVLYKKMLLSPKQAEDRLRAMKVKGAKQIIGKLAYKPQGKRALVSEFDSRPDIESAGDAFENLDDLA